MSSEKSFELKVAFGKATISMIPYIGPIAAELLGTVIPDKRYQRLDFLLNAISSRISKLEEKAIKNRVLNEEFSDLFEDAMFASTRSDTNKKIEYIAEIISNSISSDSVNIANEKSILKTLDQLNETHIIKLYSYTIKAQRDRNFIQMHRHIIIRPSAVIGLPTEEYDKVAYYDMMTNHLITLGLLKRANVIDKGSPKINKVTSEFETKIEITQTGILLLRKIRLLTDNEY